LQKTAVAGGGLSRLIDAVAFPALNQAIASGALDDQDGLGGEFEFGLGIILTGIDALIATTTGSAPGRPSHPNVTADLGAPRSEPR
jgi:hypothetical protein